MSGDDVKEYRRRVADLEAEVARLRANFPDVHITREVGRPDFCRVRHGGRVLFEGYSYPVVSS